jgi:hypothetical protein
VSSEKQILFAPKEKLGKRWAGHERERKEKLPG